MSRETEIIALGDRLYDGNGGGEVKDGASPDELLATLNRGERSLAEAEGLGAWDQRHGGVVGGKEPAPAKKPGASKKLSLEEAKARARHLRNPRDWEKK
jgi:uncharacterized protein